VGICVSSGSSCASGAIKESRIRKILQTGEKGGEIRISIGKHNTKEEVERFFEVLTRIYNAVVVLS
jgi:cysteine desulfurase